MSFSLPYYRQPDQLLGSLPEQQEIDEATKILPTIRDTNYGGHLVVARDLFVVKYGPYVTENEGYALLFIEQKLSIPAPHLPSVLNRHQPTFTHGDPYRENIPVRKVNNPPSSTEEYQMLVSLIGKQLDGILLTGNMATYFLFSNGPMIGQQV